MGTLSDIVGDWFLGLAAYNCRQKLLDFARREQIAAYSPVVTVKDRREKRNRTTERPLFYNWVFFCGTKIAPAIIAESRLIEAIDDDDKLYVPSGPHSQFHFNLEIVAFDEKLQRGEIQAADAEKLIGKMVQPRTGPYRFSQGELIGVSKNDLIIGFGGSTVMIPRGTELAAVD